ncbi:Spore germination protein YndE [compost metagenome]
MKTYAGKEITFIQFVCIISGIQVSVAVLSLPRKLAERAGTDGWISLLIGWALSAAASLFIVQVMKKHPEGTLLDLVTRYIGVWAGKVIALLFALYFLFLSFDGLTKTVLIMRTWLLPTTQSYIIMILLLIPTYTMARHGPRILGRYAELVVYMSLWIPIVYLFTLKNAHWLHLLPVLKGGWKPVWSGVQATIYPSLGMVATFFLYPYLKYKEKASKGILLSITLTTLIYLFITIICFIYFSPDEIKLFNDPVISILKSIEFRFIERIEIPFIAFYLFIFSLVWIPGMYMTTFCTSWLFNKPNNRSHLQILCLAIAVSTYFLQPTYNQTDRSQIFLVIVGFIVEYIFPVCLLIYLVVTSRVQRRKDL